MKSVNVTVAPVNWLPNTPNSATGYFYNVPLNEITADIVNRGAVLGYMQATNGAWLALPWTDFYSNFSQVFNYTYNTAFFQPQIKDSDLRSVRPTTDRVYKVVIIAPSGLVGGVNTADYLAVRRAYNLDAVEAAQKERGEVAELGSK